MATRKVVQELITKWKYQVDATQIKRTAAAIKGLKKNFTEVRKSSVSFGKGEFARIKRIRSGWQGLNNQVNNYRKNLIKTTATKTADGMAGGRGRGGVASLGQSGAFLAGRMAGSSALTSALLGGAGLAGTFGIGAAIRQAGRRQREEVGMTGLLGGKGKGEGAAKELMDQINAMAVQTPFQISDLRALSREALGGGFGKEEVLPLIGMLGDATQGRLPELRRMLTNMVEIRNTQRASLRDVRQFGRAGIPIYEALNKVLGTTGDELGDMISARKIGLKEITAALKLMTSEGGRFHNLMKDQMDTVLGKASNLIDAFEIVGERAGAPLLGISGDFLDVIREGTENITPNLENFGVGISAMVKSLKELWKNNVVFSSLMKGGFFALLLKAGVWLAKRHPLVFTLTLVATAIEDIGAALNGQESYFTSFMNWLQKIDSLKSTFEWIEGLFKKDLSHLPATPMDFLQPKKMNLDPWNPMIPAMAVGGGGVDVGGIQTTINMSPNQDLRPVLEDVTRSNVDYSRGVNRKQKKN